MTHRYLFADEAGDFTFQHGNNISKYFILCTVTMDDLSVGDGLCELRRKLVWQKEPGLGEFFHASADKQAIRDEVFAELVKHDFRIQATICEKSKAKPSIREKKARFYKYPWYYQFKHGLAPHLSNKDRLLVTAASLGTKKERLTFLNDLDDVFMQSMPQLNWAVDFRPSRCEPCLQAADYCAWAIQRRWEMADNRSYDLISDRITYEYELWKHGSHHYY